MIKDDRIFKPRLRLCPFCGASGMQELMSPGAVAFVRCNACLAKGPTFAIGGYLRDDFRSMTQAEQDEEWKNATIAAKHNAMIQWNRRPWEGSYFPEDLEDLERKMKQESGALYGKSCSEDAVPCGD